MSPVIHHVSENLVNAAVNGVCQGVALVLVVEVALRLFRGTNAATRHAVWYVALLVVAALIPAQILLPTAPRFPSISPAFGLVSEVGPVVNPGLPQLAGPTGANPVESMVASLGVVGPEPLRSPSPGERLAGEPSVGHRVPQTTPNRPGEGASPDRDVSFDGPAAGEAPVPNARNWILLPPAFCSAIICGWLLLAALRFSWIALRLVEMRRLKNSAADPGDALRMLFERLCSASSVRRPVALKTSNCQRTAVLLGYVHPVVLLPAEMDQPEALVEAEQVLRHELAHVRRKDDWSNLFQQLLQATFFFHPAVWWASRRISLEREIACDDHVLEASGKPHDYAFTLANLASRMGSMPQSLATGVSNNKTQLHERINMILNPNRNRSPRLARIWLASLTTAIAGVAGLALMIAPRMVLAQSSVTESVSSSADADGLPVVESDLIAESTPAAIPSDPTGQDSDPKLKLVLRVDSQVAPAPAVGVVVAESPAPPEAPEPPAPPTPAPGPDAPKPAAAPARFRADRTLSIEERLDRIEQMLASMKAKGETTYVSRANVWKPSTRPPEAWSYSKLTQSPDAPTPKGSASGYTAQSIYQGASDVYEEAAKQGQRAMEIAKRSTEQAVRDLERLKNRDFVQLQERLAEMGSESRLKTLKALRDAEASLQDQIKSMEAQIRKLEQEHQQLRKQADRGKDADAGSQDNINLEKN